MANYPRDLAASCAMREFVLLYVLLLVFALLIGVGLMGTLLG